MLSFHSRTGYPLPVSPAASPLTLHRPTLSKQCFRFTLHLSSRVVPVTCFVRDVYHEPPYRDSCTYPVHELLLQNFAIENRYYIRIPALYNCSGEELAVLATCTVWNGHAPFYINSHQTSVVMRPMIDTCVTFLHRRTLRTSFGVPWPWHPRGVLVFELTRLTAGVSQASLSWRLEALSVKIIFVHANASDEGTPLTPVWRSQRALANAVRRTPLTRGFRIAFL